MSFSKKRVRGFLRRPTSEQLRDIGSREYLDLHPDELSEYVRILDGLLASFDHLDDMEIGRNEVRVRTFSQGRKPTHGEDPYNAFIRHCLVKETEEGSLSGLTFGVKDSIAVAGIPLSNGSRTAPYVPTSDAVVVERALGAGALLTGILNMDDWSAGSTGETSAYGPPLNPHNLERSAGGSSGGAGAAVAGGVVDVALAVDQAGSGRIPASYCGVVSLKPTHGLLPTHGVTHISHNLDAVAPMARSVETIARTVDVLAGFDERDPQVEYDTYPSLDLLGSLGQGVSGMRIGVVQESLNGEHCSPDIREAINQAVSILRSAGATVDFISCAVWEDSWPVTIASVTQLGWAMIQSEGQGVGHMGESDVERVRHFAMSRRLEGDEFPPFIKAWVLLGRYLHEDYYSAYMAKAQNARKYVRSRVSVLFRKHDILLSPTTPTSAPILDFESRGSLSLLDRGSRATNTAIFNLTGHPAISVPVGWDSKGLPMAVQLAAAHFKEPALIRAAEELESQAGIWP